MKLARKIGLTSLQTRTHWYIRKDLPLFSGGALGQAHARIISLMAVAAVGGRRRAAASGTAWLAEGLGRGRTGKGRDRTKKVKPTAMMKN